MAWAIQAVLSVVRGQRPCAPDAQSRRLDRLIEEREVTRALPEREPGVLEAIARQRTAVTTVQ